MVVVHVAKAPTLEKAFKGQQYLFYDYKTFEEEDNIIGLYMRLSYYVRQKKADLLIFDFERIDSINLAEFNDLSRIVTCINLRTPLPSDLLTEASNTYVELDDFVRTGRTKRNFKDIVSTLTRPQAMVSGAVDVLRKILGI